MIVIEMVVVIEIMIIFIIMMMMMMMMTLQGLHSSADVSVSQFLKACETYQRKELRIELFCSQVGLFDKQGHPSMDIRDTDFLLQTLLQLLNEGHKGVHDDDDDDDDDDTVTIIVTITIIIIITITSPQAN